MTTSRESTDSRPENARHIPCLDGLRAVSILLVLFTHARLTGGFPQAPWIQSIQLGIVGTGGVCLFFIISGYLITTLILNEKARYGSISLRDFYIRRSLRIFPAFYVFLAVEIVLRHIGFSDFTNMGLFASAAYWRNFYEVHNWSLGHTWSLSVEEQFYLMWPLCVARMSDRRATLLAATVVIAWPLLRLLRHHFLSSDSGTIALNTAAGDTILYGCLLALWTRDVATRELFQRLKNGSLMFCIPVAILVFIYFTCHAWPSKATFLLPILRNISLTWALWWCVCNPATAVGRTLDWKPVVFVGWISYSLYIWQQIFMFPNKAAWICQFPQNVVLAVVVATMSYYLVESPLNSMRSRFSASARHAKMTAASRAVAND